MKKSSLGRRSLAQATVKKDAPESFSSVSRKLKESIPVRSSSTYGFLPTSRTSNISRDANARPPRPMTSSSGSISSGRASSIGGQISQQADERPLHDKDWQVSTSRELMNFLLKDVEGSKIAANLKNLRNMSLALFLDILNVLIQKLDKNVSFTKQNYMYEVPKYLKMLDYRGKMDKSLLQTVNTLHNWPHVLGILHYIYELVRGYELFEQKGLPKIFQDSGATQSKKEKYYDSKAVYDYISKCYSDVLSGRDLKANINQYIAEYKVSNGLSDDIFKELSKVKQESEELSKKVESNKMQLAEMEKEINDILAKTKERKDKIAQSEHEVVVIEKKVWEIEAATVDVENECQLLTMNLNELTEKKEKIMEEQNQLAITQNEKRKESMMKCDLVLEIKSEQAINDDIHKYISEADMRIGKSREEVFEFLKEYNSKVLYLVTAAHVPDFDVQSVLIPYSSNLTIDKCVAAINNLKVLIKNFKSELAEMESLQKKVSKWENVHKELLSQFNTVTEEGKNAESSEMELNKLINEIEVKKNEKSKLIGEIQVLTNLFKEKEKKYAEDKIRLENIKAKLQLYKDKGAEKLKDMDEKIKKHLEEMEALFTDEAIVKAFEESKKK